MHANTVRGFIFGVITGFTLYHVLSDAIVDRAADRVIQKITIEEVDKPNPIMYAPPVVKPIIPPTEPKPIRVYVPKRHLNKAELYCLAKNIYHEAGVEDYEGKIAVGQVTFNRVDHKRWGNTVCKVVYERKQFSWTNSAKLRKEQPKGPLWEESKRAALAVMNGERIPGLEVALFYHTDYIRSPAWASPVHELAQIGSHIFYKEDRKA